MTPTLSFRFYLHVLFHIAPWTQSAPPVDCNSVPPLLLVLWRERPHIVTASSVYYNQKKKLNRNLRFSYEIISTIAENTRKNLPQCRIKENIQSETFLPCCFKYNALSCCLCPSLRKLSLQQNIIKPHVTCWNKFLCTARLVTSSGTMTRLGYRLKAAVYVRCTAHTKPSIFNVYLYRHIHTLCYIQNIYEFSCKFIRTDWFRRHYRATVMNDGGVKENFALCAY